MQPQSWPGVYSLDPVWSLRCMCAGSNHPEICIFQPDCSIRLVEPSAVPACVPMRSLLLLIKLLGIGITYCSKLSEHPLQPQQPAGPHVLFCPLRTSTVTGLGEDGSGSGFRQESHSLPLFLYKVHSSPNINTSQIAVCFWPVSRAAKLFCQFFFSAFYSCFFEERGFADLLTWEVLPKASEA